MPGYSVLLSPVDHAGWSAAAAGVVLSAAFQFGSLAVLWIGFFDGVRSARNLAALGTAAVFPGVIYYAAVFPLSLLTFVTLLAILAALRGRAVLAAVAVAIAAATYPIGIVVAVALAVWEVAAPGTMRQRFGRSGLIVAAGVASLVAVSGSQRLMTGRWDGYFLIQRHYGHTGMSPFSVLRMAKEQALSFAHDPHRLSLVPALQLLLVATFVIGVVVTFLLTRRRDDFPAVLVVVSAWLMPLALGGVSLYRSDAVLLPGVLVTRRLPVAVQLAFAVVAGLIMFEMTQQFFEGVLA
jgi:Gpi18-like mannosyltransferase